MEVFYYVAPKKIGKNFLMLDVSKDELLNLLELAEKLKIKDLIKLKNKVLGLIFDKSSPNRASSSSNVKAVDLLLI